MKELIEKLNEMIEYCSAKTRQSETLIAENENLRIQLNQKEDELDNREDEIIVREKKVTMIENVEQYHKEAHDKNQEAVQRHLSIDARRDDLEREYQKKFKSLEDDRASLLDQQENLKQAYLTLDADKKSYKQRVIEAVHKDSETGRSGLGVRK